MHIAQGIDKLAGDAAKPVLVTHPIELFARSYGIV